MWFLYIVAKIGAHAWQTGSLLLPLCLLIRWGAGKWKPLHRLTTSRSHWLRIWGWVGFGQAIVVTLIEWGGGSFPPFDSLGWASSVISSGLYALRIHTAKLAVQFELTLGLWAVGEAAIFCAVSAIAWWLYAALARQSAVQRRFEKYRICLLISACVLGVVNNPTFWRSSCLDCFAPHGIPFTYFHEGGFAGGDGFLWLGILGNSIAVVALAFVFYGVWAKRQMQTPD